MSGRIPRARKLGHGDPKFCSCVACKAIVAGKKEVASSMQGIPSDRPKIEANGPFPESGLSGTLEFSARGFQGYYNLAGEWISSSMKAGK